MPYLKEQGFNEVQVVAGRRTPFPNGPAQFFLNHGFTELEEVDRVVLKGGEEELVLLRKELANPE